MVHWSHGHSAVRSPADRHGVRGCRLAAGRSAQPARSEQDPVRNLVAVEKDPLDRSVAFGQARTPRHRFGENVAGARGVQRSLAARERFGALGGHARRYPPGIRAAAGLVEPL
ncbi:MAG: hypothetical protein HLUCCA12_17230 [Rhodobacteraceae bacterium HLUCCA12]|nr:MAG: hypothetical protein HLUCCA12_17230 [Rhodobacteraceae bacterium HLUCCA12]